MERWGCADIPGLALQMLLEAHPDWRPLPVAVVDRDTAQGVVLQSNRIARESAIRPGMRYAAALALHRDLRAAVVSPTEVAQTCQRVLAALREFSPYVEEEREQPGLFWLRASGLDRLFGGFDVWARGLYAHLQETLGLYASITVGWTRFGTFAASRARPVGWRVFGTAEDEQRAQGAVPLDLLGLPPRTVERLEKLAVTRVDDFLALPPSGIRKRFGAEAAQLWRFAHGGGDVPLQPAAWDEPVAATLGLDDPLSDMTQLTFLLKAALHPLLLDLAGRHCDLRELAVHLRLEDGDDHDVTIRPAHPTLEEVRIIELCRLALERITLPAPIVQIDLEARGVPTHRDQNHLFRDNARRDLHAANHALARLQAEHPGAVFRVALQDRHLPEARYTLEPFEALGRPQPREPERPSLVRRIYTRPVPLPRFDPDIGIGWLIRDLDEGFVMRASGPHRVSGGWWLDGHNAADHIVARRLADGSTHHASPRARHLARDGEFIDEADDDDLPAQNAGDRVIGVSRDYWLAETDRGDVFWVYWDMRRRQWFLHGVVE